MPLGPNLPQWALVVLPLIVLWDLVWRGFALWRAARRGSKVWFVCLIIFNTLGLLPIVYLFISRGDQPGD
jgi:Family of unknown function (DUF5652)